jgi:acetolactate synthase I/II/III large subunit
MKASDYIAEFLAKEGVKHVFGVTGGMIIHIFDSIAKRKDIGYICTEHEQAAAIAADGYSRITNNLGVAITTSGPGATNLLTGTGCSYYDSIPVLNITGQVATSRLKRDKGVRQFGFQESPIQEIFSPITKYSAFVEDANQLKYELEKAVYIAKSGRPGPVLLDIPDDIQRAEINPELMPSFILERNCVDYDGIREKIKQCIPLIEKSKRPMILLGAGVKLGKSEEEAINFVRQLNFPVGLTWATKDMFLYNDKLYAGEFGVASQRYGNFAVQNSDLIIAIGTRMDQHHTGTPQNTFAREAKKIMLDVDNSELEKFKGTGLEWDVLINADVKDFFMLMNEKIDSIKTGDISAWLKKIEEFKKKYPSCPEKYLQEKDVNPYVFSEELSRQTLEGDIIVADTGSNLAQIMGGYKFRKKQKLFSDFNHTTMGYSLPASIGACFANDKRQIICISGDGGIQMNIQELATIKYHNLPIKIFVFNNSGYGMIQQTQDDWLNSKYEASTINSGVAIPDFYKIGKAYGLKVKRIKNNNELKNSLEEIMKYNGPVLCDVMLSPNQRILPFLKVGRPIEDPKPLLPRDEFLNNMIVKPTEQSLKEG